jgi:predicted alpha/beta-fold hydrolase
MFHSFSLGANVALKALGELGEDALEKYNIRGGGLLCTPFDQERNALALAQPGINRVIYTNSLLKSLKQKAQEKLDKFCNGDTDTTVFDYKRAMEAETITVFDDAFIAPIYNFTDCWDYYQKTSSIYYMEDVAVPTYSINAADGKQSMHSKGEKNYCPILTAYLCFSRHGIQILFLTIMSSL